jgi:flagellar biosynthetic protein FlhB
MSKQDIKDESKQTDGDPMVKARIRGLRLERGRQRMMQAVPEADVVITNPTHFAVALQYDAKSMEAPKLIAKGVDHLALRIREIAEENGIPVVENPPVARALYATVEVDAEVPGEHYKAVAEIIGYVMKLKGAKAVQRYTAPREDAESAGADAGV